MKTKVYMMIGCPGSGKSTWIKNNLGEDFPVVSRDIIREELGLCGSGEKCVGTAREEKQITEIENSKISEFLRAGKEFALDDTNLNVKYRPAMIESLRRQGAWVIGVRVNTDLNTCFRRRSGQIPPAALRAMHSKVSQVSPTEFDEFIDVTGE